MVFEYSLFEKAEQLLKSGDETSIQKCHQMLEMHTNQNICSDTSKEDLIFEKLCKYISEHKKIIALTKVNIRKNELEYAIKKIDNAKQNMEEILKCTKQLQDFN